MVADVGQLSLVVIGAALTDVKPVDAKLVVIAHVSRTAAK